MAAMPLTPVQIIDEVFQAEAVDGEVFISLASYGAPVRLRINPRDAMMLSLSSKLAAERAIEQRHVSCQVFPFARRA